MCLLALVYWVALTSQAQAGTVTMPRSFFESLQSKPIDSQVERQAADPWVGFREVTFRSRRDGLEVLVRWEIRTQKPGSFRQAFPTEGLSIQQITWDGKSIALEEPKSTPRPQKGTPERIQEPEITGWVTDRSTVILRAWVSKASFKEQARRNKNWGHIRLMEAVAGSVMLLDEEQHLWVAPTPARESMYTPIRDRMWTGEDAIFYQLRPKDQPVPRAALTGEVDMGMGLSVLDGVLMGQAKMRWRFHTGQTKRLRFTVRDFPSSLRIDGPAVKRWERSGSTIIVHLNEVTRRPVELDLTWKQAVSVEEYRELSIPSVRLQSSFLLNSHLQLASSGDLDVIPSVSRARSISAEELPTVAKDLIQATPTATYQAQGPIGGQLTLYRFRPAEAPPLMVDVASSTVALTREGRSLARTRLTVRNERASHLHFCLPKGHHLLGITVSGKGVSPQRFDACFRVPVPRSVESLKGGIAFPVDVIFRGEMDPWAMRESRTLDWLVVDAPTAVSRVSLHLPEQYAYQSGQGADFVVGEFTEGEGLAYGYGLGGEHEARADQLFQAAVDNWMRNDFDEAYEQLVELDAIGAENSNIERLKSNLSIVRDGAKVDAKQSAMGRRIKEQAKARASKDKRRQADAMDEAEQAMMEGEYKKAEMLYQEVEEISQVLGALEQEESVEEKSIKLKAKKGLKRAKGLFLGRAKAASPPPPPVPMVESRPEGESVDASPESIDSTPGYDFDEEPLEMSHAISGSEIGSGFGMGFSSKGRGGGGMGGGRSADFNRAQPTPLDDSPTETVVVASTSIDLVIPSRGETVRYQQLLLEPGQAPKLKFEAKRPRRK